MQLHRRTILRRPGRHRRAVPRRARVERRLQVSDVIPRGQPDRAHAAGHAPEDLERDREVVRREDPDAVDVVVRLPQPTRVVGARAPRPAAPSGRSRPARGRPGGSATCPSRRAGRAPSSREADGLAQRRRRAASRRRPARRARARPRTTSACVLVGVATTIPSTSGSPATSATTALAPPSRARATLASERATTGTSQPSARRSRRMCTPQRPHPTSPTTIVDPRRSASRLLPCGDVDVSRDRRGPLEGPIRDWCLD